MPHVYMTGDIHGNADRIQYFCERCHTTKDDVMIILGDVGCNYYGNSRDDLLKRYMESLPITFVLLRGNHEMRPPADIYKRNYLITPGNNAMGVFMYEPAYPSLLFTVDCMYYNFVDCEGNNQSAYALGGAYSVDKYYRLQNHWQWFADEQLSEDERKVADWDLRNLKAPDFIMSHTCPYSARPTDMFISGLDQSTVDDSMERWLDKINEDLEHPRWYCGHWHTDRTADNVRFLYKDFIELG